MLEATALLPQDRPSIREVSQRLPHQPLQLLVLASAPSADSEQRPHQLPGPWHAHPWAPPALQGRCVFRDKKDLGVFTACAPLCRQGDGMRKDSQLAQSHTSCQKWKLMRDSTLPSPPAPSQKREVYTVPCTQKASLQLLPVHTGSRTLAWISFPDKCNWEGCDT